MDTTQFFNDDKNEQERLREALEKLANIDLGEDKEPINYANVLSHSQDDWLKDVIWKDLIWSKRTKWESHLRRHKKAFLICNVEEKKFIGGPVVIDTAYNLSQREKDIMLNRLYRCFPDTNKEERESVGVGIAAGALQMITRRNWIMGRAFLVESLLALNLPDTNFFYITLPTEGDHLSMYTYHHIPLQVIEGGQQTTPVS